MSAERAGSDGSLPIPRVGPTDHAVGDAVLDREAAPGERDTAVVVNLPPTTCDEWVARRHGDEEVTVADDNPRYDPKTEVVVVIFEDRLDGEFPEWDRGEPIPLAEAESYYAFPPRRLVPAENGTEPKSNQGERHGREDQPTAATDAGHPELTALAERVDGEVVAEGGEPEIVVERLGATHRISADGSVAGGPMKKQLAETATEFLGGGDQ